MDDSDAVLAQAARTMLETGDWVTPRLDGVAYLEKPPLYYWPMVLSYKVFGVHDWAARIPFALSCDGARVANGGDGRLGVRQTRGILRRVVHGDVHWVISLHAHS